MKKILAAGLGAFLYLTQSLSGQTTDQTNNLSVLEQKVSSHKTEMNVCISNFSKTNASSEEMAGFSMDAGFILEKYERFRNTLGSNDLCKIEADTQLTMNAAELYIKRADRSMVTSEFDKKRPSANIIDDAIANYQKAYALLKKREDSEEFIGPARKIEEGLAKAIIGYNGFGAYLRTDSFMNPDGKEWEENPSVRISELKDEIKTKRIYLEEVTVYKKGIERSIGSIKKATDASNGAAALEGMDLGAKWLTNLLGKDKSLFVKYFSEFNSVSKPAMEIVKKKYDEEKMKEFRRFYEPLTSHYRVLTQPSSK